MNQHLTRKYLDKKKIFVTLNYSGLTRKMNQCSTRESCLQEEKSMNFKCSVLVKKLNQNSQLEQSTNDFFHIFH